MTERRELPLFAWGDALSRKRVRRTRGRARATIIAAAVASVPLLVTIAAMPVPRLVWNASASAPLGLYQVTPDAPVRSGDMVIAWVPEGARMLAARRRYLPANVPLVKRVAATSGDTVCAIGPVVSINGSPIAERRRFDGHGRVLPWWEGCVTLRAGELFLLMADAADSFDGRYFGPTGAQGVLGRARLLWPAS